MTQLYIYSTTLHGIQKQDVKAYFCPAAFSPSIEMKCVHKVAGNYILHVVPIGLFPVPSIFWIQIRETCVLGHFLQLFIHNRTTIEISKSLSYRHFKVYFYYGLLLYRRMVHLTWCFIHLGNFSISWKTKKATHDFMLIHLSWITFHANDYLRVKMVKENYFQP